MTNMAAQNVLRRVFEAYPSVPAVICFVFTGATGYGLWSTYSSLSRMPAAPVASALDAAAAEHAAKGMAWVKLEGMDWRCSDAYAEPDGSDRVFPLTDAATGGFVAFSPAYKAGPCEQHASAPPVGTLEPMSAARYDRLTSKGWKALEAVPREKAYVMCAGCGPEDARLGLKICGAAFALSLVLFLFYLRRALSSPPAAVPA